MSNLPQLVRAALGKGGEGKPSKAERNDTFPLDFQNPLHNLYAFARLWATLDDQPVFSAFHGLMFGQIGDSRLKPLFGNTGFGQFQARLLDNGNVKLRGKETGLFTDLASGRILSYWDNPYTGESVKVFNFLNDRIRGELTPVMPEFQLGDSSECRDDHGLLLAYQWNQPDIGLWQVQLNLPSEPAKRNQAVRRDKPLRTSRPSTESRSCKNVSRRS